MGSLTCTQLAQNVVLSPGDKIDISYVDMHQHSHDGWKAILIELTSLGCVKVYLYFTYGQVRYLAKQHDEVYNKMGNAGHQPKSKGVGGKREQGAVCFKALRDSCPVQVQGLSMVLSLSSQWKTWSLSRSH